MAEVLVENWPMPMKRIGVRDTFAESGPYLEVIGRCWLPIAHIHACVHVDWRSRRSSCTPIHAGACMRRARLGKAARLATRPSRQYNSADECLDESGTKEMVIAAEIHSYEGLLINHNSESTMSHRSMSKWAAAMTHKPSRS